MILAAAGKVDPGLFGLGILVAIAVVAGLVWLMRKGKI